LILYQAALARRFKLLLAKDDAYLSEYFGVLRSGGSEDLRIHVAYYNTFAKIRSLK